ncbi:MAG: STAS domain-containing protein [Gemmataceae bacterium]|nr:STAS domain-containing protein [Gemmataceae bacterium]
MAEMQGKVSWRADGDALTVRVEGRGTMAHGLPLQRLGERLLASGVRAVRIDLRACPYMDSTFLGTLLALNKALGRLGAGPLAIVAPTVACSKILDQMGLGEMLPVQAGTDHDPAGWHELPPDTADAPALRRNIVEAHERLAELPGPAGQQFQAVLRCLAAEAKPKNPPGE